MNPSTCKGLGRLLGGHRYSPRFSTSSLETKDANGASHTESRSTWEGEVCSWCGHFLAPSRSPRSAQLAGIGVHEGDAEPPRQRSAA
jgi:hypothetical protein